MNVDKTLVPQIPVSKEANVAEWAMISPARVPQIAKEDFASWSVVMFAQAIPAEAVARAKLAQMVHHSFACVELDIEETTAKQ